MPAPARGQAERDLPPDPAGRPSRTFSPGQTAKILLVESYYGGSHRAFLDGLIRHLPCRYLLLSLPARKWKMKMQLSAPWFAGQIRALEPAERHFTAVVLSGFVDVALFRALVGSLDGWNRQCRFLTYFHENQFVYPGRHQHADARQFMALNFTSAVASDAVAFNSRYNQQSFLAGCRGYTAKAVDFSIEPEITALEKRSRVLYPGMDYEAIDQIGRVETSGPPLIIWNHRWEHDKNPEEFFAVLARLKQRRISFRLAVLGQSFGRQPHCFASARKELEGQLIHFGYLDDRNMYYRLLAQGDVIVSTALHEFFGMAVLEAVRAGCTPLLPRRLSYPELFEEAFLYAEGQLEQRLERALASEGRLSQGRAMTMTEPYAWASLEQAYRQWLGLDAEEQRCSRLSEE